MRILGWVVTTCVALLAACGSVKDNPVDAAADSPTVLIDASIDAAVDAPPDAPSLTDFDIAYINELTFQNNISSIGNFMVVINKGPVPLDLSTASVVVFSDDNAAVTWTFAAAGAATGLLPPNNAAGSLSPLATQKIIDTGLVPEPFATGTSFGFFMSFANVPAGVTFNLNAQATIRIDAEDITLPFTIHFVPTGSTAFNNASRINTPL